MALRVGYTVGLFDSIPSSYVDDAIIYAADNGAKILNMSFRCDVSSAINAALNYAYNTEGCLIVAAAGNDHKYQQIVYPARHDKVIAVSGIDKQWVPLGTYYQEGDIDLIAPSWNIYSSVNHTALEQYKCDNAGIGTSFSSPQVAGAAALLWSYRPNLAQFDILDILKKTAQWHNGFTVQHVGSGLLDVQSALLEAETPSPGTPQNLTVTATPGTHPVLSWSSVQGATQYKIYRANTISGRYNYQVAATTSIANGEESISSNDVTCGTNASGKSNSNLLTRSFDYSLKSNYPNPFNPSTTISYSIREKEFVSLKIYDILGREIISLANETKEPGEYVVKFNAEGLPSGIYICSLISANYSATKKMVLTK